MIASTPTSTNFPAQISPGFTVPGRFPLLFAVDRGIEQELDHREDSASRGRNPDVFHELLEVREAVLDRDPVRQGVSLLAREGHLGAEDPRDGQRSKVGQAVRQVAQSLAEQERRRQDVEVFGPDIRVPHAADLPPEAERQDRLVHVTLEDAVLDPEPGLPNPDVLPSSGSFGLRKMYSVSIETPRFGVMVFENSAPTDVSFASGLLMCETDGSVRLRPRRTGLQS